MHTPFSFPSTLTVDIAFTDARAKELYQGLPQPATQSSAGTDLRSLEDLTFQPGERAKVHTGIRIQPKTPGVAGFIYSRSGLGARDGLTVAQGVGVIDPDYTGELLVVLLNTSSEVRRICKGERIAQLVFQPYFVPQFSEQDDLQETHRGDGGFGHTGR